MPNELTRTEKVAAEIRAEMGRQLISLASLADVVGMPISTLRRSVNGHRALTLDELAAISEALSVSPAHLIRRTDIATVA